MAPASINCHYLRVRLNSKGSKKMNLRIMPPSLIPRGSLRVRLKSKRSRTMSERMRRLKSDMKEICKEQEEIRRGQKQVKENFMAIERECERLKQETAIVIEESRQTQSQLREKFMAMETRWEHLRRENGLIIRQGMKTQIASALMQRIINAMEADDVNAAAKVRKIIALVVLFLTSAYFV